MTDMTKYQTISRTMISDLKTHFLISRTQRTVAVAYCFVFIFTAVTIFIAFNPSSNSSYPRLTEVFSVTNTSPSYDSYRSHFCSIFCYLFPNSSSSSSSRGRTFLRAEDSGSHGTNISQPNSNKGSAVMENQTKNKNITQKVEVSKQNQYQSEEFGGEVEALKVNHSATPVRNSPETSNKNTSSSASSASEVKNIAAIGEKGIANNALVKNLTTSLMKKQHNGSHIAKVKQGFHDLIKPLLNCDFFDGNWLRDESYPLYKPGSCSLIDEQFNCFVNGRHDDGYNKLKWKPKSCTLPRLNGSHMLELLRGKRLVFVGDSLNRNMWESLICILRNSVKDKNKVYEVSGRQHFRTEASYSFVFEDYKCTLEFFVTPFLVREWEVSFKNGTKKETLRLDLMSRLADKYKDADIIIFNTGHWWTHEKTSKGKDYYQEGSHVYDELNALEAFRKAITTWGKWIDDNVNPVKSLVFFRGYSASHFSGGQWNSGGQCDNETEPITFEAYLSEYPSKMTVVEQVLKGLRTPVTYMNVTRMTDYRKDGHPSIYRKRHLSDDERRTPLRFQDCSHWCLPGVPDAWNEILYAQLLVKLNENGRSQVTA